MFRNIRYRIAKRLAGPFVQIPERQGVWVVIREVDDDYSASITLEADKFRMRSGINLHPKDFASLADIQRTGRSRKWGRFVGTVKYT